MLSAAKWLPILYIIPILIHDAELFRVTRQSGESTNSTTTSVVVNSDSQNDGENYANQRQKSDDIVENIRFPQEPVDMFRRPSPMHYNPPSPMHYNPPSPMHYNPPSPMHYNPPSPMHYKPPPPGFRTWDEFFCRNHENCDDKYKIRKFKPPKFPINNNDNNDNGPVYVPVTEIDRAGNTYGGRGRCTSPYGDSGNCIPVIDCAPLYDLLRTRNTDNNVIAYMRQSQCGFSGKSPVVCCPDNGAPVIPTDSPTPSRSTFGPTTGSTSNFPCGVSTGSTEKIVGGRKADAGMWPWMVALGYDRPSAPGDISFNCGGTLISDRHVLTASHCIRNIGNYRLSVIRLGDLNLDPRVADGSEPMTVEVGDVITHPSYTDSPVTNDIAIIKLKKSVPYTKFIRPVCLPAEQTLRTDMFAKKQPFIMGWGATAWRGASENHLQESSVPTVDVEACKKNYAREPSARIDERVICAGGKGKNDTCQGDSGGPLILPILNDKTVTYYIIGIVSFGKRCAEPGYPGVYTRVTHFVDWIQQNMN